METHTQNGADWALLDIPLPASAVTLRQETRAFVRREIMPRAAEIEKSAKIPDDLWPKMGQAGLLGITVSPAYGGAGLGYLEHMIAMEEISRASAAVGFSYLVHSQPCVNQIFLYGTEAQKQKYLPGLLSGSRIGGLALTEPEAGSDAIGGMKMTAMQDGKDFVLQGKKAWIANAPCADILVTYAKTRPEAGGKGISAFIVDTHQPGVALGPARSTLGVRGCPVGDVDFEGCRLGNDHLLGPLNEGAAILMDGLERERLVASGGPLGLLLASLDAALPHCAERHQFGQPIGRFQLVQTKLVDMLMRLNASRAYAYAAAVAHGSTAAKPFDSTALLLYVAECASAVAADVVQLFGAAGFDADSVAARLYRDVRLFSLGFGSSEIRRMVVGRALLNGAKRA